MNRTVALLVWSSTPELLFPSQARWENMLPGGPVPARR